MVSAKSLCFLALVATCLNSKSFAVSVIDNETTDFELESAPNVSASCCPSAFRYHADGIPKRYAVITQPMSWDAAQRRCKQLHPRANLVVINSALENQVVRSILEGKVCPRYATHWQDGFWTSGRRMHSDCSKPFSWHLGNGNTNLQMRYTDWCKGNPSCSGGTEYCVSLLRNCAYQVLAWNDDNCSWRLCSVCELMITE